MSIFTFSSRPFLFLSLSFVAHYYPLRESGEEERLVCEWEEDQAILSSVTNNLTGQHRLPGEISPKGSKRTWTQGEGEGGCLLAYTSLINMF